MQKVDIKKMSKIGFIFSVFGAVIGLSNFWLFPSKMIDYGGTVFLIPYFIGLLFIGLPFLILEFNLGANWRKAPTNFYNNYFGKSGKFVAFMQAGVQLLFNVYYAVLVSWVLVFFGVSFTNHLGESNFFEQNIFDWNNSETGKSFFDLGKIQPFVFIAFALIIFVSCLIVAKGAIKGIEKFNKIVFSLFVILILCFFFYSFNLVGASRGLDFVLKPEINKLQELKTWWAAFEQAALTLASTVLIIIVYSMRAPENSDSTNQAIIIISGNILFTLFFCLIVGGILGYADNNNLFFFDKGSIYKTNDSLDVQSLENVKPLTGIGLIFSVFPIAFQAMNNDFWSGAGNLVGLVFYIILLCVFISSMIALLESTVINFEDFYRIKRSNAILFVCFIQFLIGLTFTFEGSEHLMEIIKNYSLILLSLFLICLGIMCIWTKKKIQSLILRNNLNSRYHLNFWYRYLLIISIGLLLFASVLSFVFFDYGQYNVFQWSISTIVFFLPLFFFVFLYGYQVLLSWRKDQKFCACKALSGLFKIKFLKQKYKAFHTRGNSFYHWTKNGFMTFSLSFTNLILFSNKRIRFFVFSNWKKFQIRFLLARHWIKTKIILIIKPFKDFINPYWSKTTLFLTNNWQRFKNFISPYWNKTTLFLTNNWQRFKNFISPYWNKTTLFLTNNWQRFKNFISPYWNKTTLFLTNNWQRFKNFMILCWNKTTLFLTNNWQRFKNFISPYWNKTTLFLANSWHKFKSWNVSFYYWIKRKIIIIFQSSKKFIFSFWNKMTLFLVNNWQRFKNFISPYWNKISVFIVNIWKKFWTWISFFFLWIFKKIFTLFFEMIYFFVIFWKTFKYYFFVLVHKIKKIFSFFKRKKKDKSPETKNKE